MLSENEITDIYLANRQLLYKIIFMYMKNEVDAEEVLSDTFYKLIDKSPTFANNHHAQAWLIKVSVNLCKNMLKSQHGKNVNIDDYSEILSAKSTTADHANNLLEIIEDLPDKYRLVIILHYYEGYTSEEISKIIKKPASTVRNYISKARIIIKEMIEND